MTEVSPTKLDAIYNKRIHLGKCRCGTGGGNIVILFPYYGKTGVRVECICCNRRTKLYSISTFITDTEGRLATPVIDKSLMRGIKQAVSDWNKGILVRGKDNKT